MNIDFNVIPFSRLLKWFTIKNCNRISKKKLLSIEKKIKAKMKKYILQNENSSRKLLTYKIMHFICRIPLQKRMPI